jgi:hypothetical protein
MDMIFYRAVMPIHPVIPAKAGIQGLSFLALRTDENNFKCNVLGFPLSRE